MDLTAEGPEAPSDAIGGAATIGVQWTPTPARPLRIGLRLGGGALAVLNPYDATPPAQVRVLGVQGFVRGTLSIGIGGTVGKGTTGP